MHKNYLYQELFKNNIRKRHPSSNFKDNNKVTFIDSRGLLVIDDNRFILLIDFNKFCYIFYFFKYYYMHILNLILLFAIVSCKITML